MNRVQLEGFVGTQIRQFATKTGEAVSFSLGTGNKNSNGDWETVWHRVVCFGKAADQAKPHMAERKKVYVEGFLKYGKYEQKDGTTRHTTDIVAFKVEAGGKSRRERLEQELAALNGETD